MGVRDVGGGREMRDEQVGWEGCRRNLLERRGRHFYVRLEPLRDYVGDDLEKIWNFSGDKKCVTT